MPKRRANPEFARRLGARLRQLREEEGVTQEQLAWDCDVSKAYMSQIESGRHVPTLAVLLSVADRLGCEVADLVALDLDRPRLATLEATRLAKRTPRS